MVDPSHGARYMIVPGYAGTYWVGPGKRGESGRYPRRVTRKGGKRDVLAIHLETAKRIRTTALENDVK